MAETKESSLSQALASQLNAAWQKLDDMQVRLKRRDEKITLVYGKFLQ